MVALPVTASMNFLQAQIAATAKMYGSLLNTSMQLGNLNATASRKLLEESTTAATKAMTLKTPWDLQAFLLEQSQLAFERLWGYRQNVQDIAASGRSDLGALPGMPAVPQPAQPEAAPAQDEDQSASKHASAHHPHEVDPHPSPLVEKLISSVVNDTEVPGQ